MKAIRQYADASSAYIAEGLLKSYNINCMVEESIASSVFPAPDAGIGQTTLYVSDSDADQAERLLREHND